MTIIAGFKCDEGVVLCADTQESLEVTKRNVAKLKVEPEYRSFKQHVAGIDLTVAFCGSGDSRFIDLITAELRTTANSCTGHDEARNAMKASVEGVYTKYRGIYQEGYCPQVDILYAIRADGESSLYLASGPLVLEKTGFECCGSGGDLANYIAGRMYHTSMTLTQCTIIAAYVLLQTKNHAQGCGGESHIAVLENNGGCRLVSATRVEAITRLVQYADSEASSLILAAANLNLPEDKFLTVLTNYGGRITEARSATNESLSSEERMTLALMAGVEAGLSGRPSGPYAEYEMDDFGSPRRKPGPDSDGGTRA